MKSELQSEMLRLIPDYLLGALPRDQQRQLDDLMSQSPAFRREVDAAAEALASATTALPQVPPPESVRSRLLQTVSSVDRFAPFLADLVELFELPVASLRRLLARIDDHVTQAWETSLMGTKLEGAELFHFPVGPRLAATGAAGGVLRVGPGVRFPRHSHGGNEVTYVLEGGYVADGRTYGPGARVEVPGETVHDYHAAPGRDLVLIVLHRGITMMPES